VHELNSAGQHSLSHLNLDLVLDTMAGGALNEATREELLSGLQNLGVDGERLHTKELHVGLNNRLE
jgi:hypothetical protein